MLYRKNKTWVTSAHRGFVTEGMHENTLSAYLLAAEKGADMIETDARTTKDGVLVANHNAEAEGFDKDGNKVCYVVSETDAETITSVILAPNDPNGPQYVPTLKEVLHLAYATGMCVNIDLKEGILHAEDVARLVVATGMRGRAQYATNGAGAEAILKILAIDPEAKFDDTVRNFTKEKLMSVPDYPSKCYVYTGDFSDENIARVRESGCMLETISINEETAPLAMRHHPDQMEYLHTSDFEAIDKMLLSAMYEDLHNGKK